MNSPTDRPGHADKIASPMKPPVGVIAAILALMVLLVVLLRAQYTVFTLARSEIRAILSSPFEIKWDSLVLQQAAVAETDILPFYGSSMLYCCGDDRYRGPAFFAREPTGFAEAAIGSPGLEAILYFQALGALGANLKGKQLVVVHSVALVDTPDVAFRSFYDGLFRPEHAYAFIFDAPLSDATRAAGAQRMNTFPETLTKEPILRAGIELLSRNDQVGLLGYSLLRPIGEALSWAKQLSDLYNVYQFIRQHPSLRPLPRDPMAVDWVDKVGEATVLTDQIESSNPFALDQTVTVPGSAGEPYRQALANFCADRNNRDGSIRAMPPARATAISKSPFWLDLSVEFSVLRELGANSLVATVPTPGVFYDFTTNRSWPERQLFYQEFSTLATAHQVPAVTFSQFDDERGFFVDPSEHLGRRGWVFFNRAIDLFWHGADVATINRDLNQLDQAAPPSPFPPKAQFCGTS